MYIAAQYTSDSTQEQNVRVALLALLRSVGLTLEDDDVRVFPILTHPGQHLVITPDELHEAVEDVSPLVGLRPVLGYRGVWVQVAREQLV